MGTLFAYGPEEDWVMILVMMIIDSNCVALFIKIKT
jgi:hypothetical protein